MLTYFAIENPADFIFRVLLLTQSPTNQTVLGPVPLGMLFASEHVRGSPYDVTVVPSAACASLSVASLVSVATVGVHSKFMLEIRDSFLNIRPCETRDWARFFGMEPIPGTYEYESLSCSFLFAPTNAAAGYINVLVENALVLPEASILIVLSGRLDLVHSAINLPSLATAGIPVYFSITFFDAINNLKDIQALSSNTEVELHNSQQHSSAKTYSPPVHHALDPLTKAPFFQFVATISSHFFISVMFMNASVSFARLPLVVLPSAACAATTSIIGDAASLVTNGATSYFYLHIRDSFGNAAFLDATTSAFVYASTAPRFSYASVNAVPSSSIVPISLLLSHTSIDPSTPLPLSRAALATIGGLIATCVVYHSIAAISTLDNFRRYFANLSSSFQPYYVQQKSGLSITSNLSVASAVKYAKFAGLLLPAISGRYTFSVSKSQLQLLSVVLKIDGADMLKLQPDGRLSVQFSIQIILLFSEYLITFFARARI